MIDFQQELVLKANFFRKVGYYPHRFQKSFHLSSARHRIIVAGSRGGKSMCAAADAAPFLLLADFRIWIISSTYDLAEKEFNWILDFLGKYKLPNGKRIIDLAKIGNAARGSRYIRFPWGAFVETKSTKNAESLLGEEVNLVILAEAATIPYSLYKRYVVRALGSRGGKTITPSTPNDDGGLLRDFYDKGISKEIEHKDYEAWQFKTKDNPTFSKAEYEIARKELPEDIFKEQWQGEFVSRKGLVLSEFTNEHIINEMPDGWEDWRVYGTSHHENNAYNNPFVYLWIAIDPKTRTLYVIDEYYSEKAIIDHETMVVREKSQGKRMLFTLCDFFNPLLKEKLKKGMSVKSNNEKKYSKRFAIVKRIQAIQAALKANDIYILSKCENLISEFQNYKWPEKKREETGQAESELPTTKNCSGPLAVSYVLAFHFVMSGRNIYESQGLIKKRRAG